MSTERTIEDGRGKKLTTAIPALTDALTILTRIPVSHRDKGFANSLAARDSRYLSQSQTFWIFKLAQDQLDRERPETQPKPIGNVKKIVEFLTPASARKTGACVTFRNNMPGHGMSNNGTVQIKSSSGHHWKGHYWISNGGTGAKDIAEPTLPPEREGVFAVPVDTREYGTITQWQVAYDGQWQVNPHVGGIGWADREDADQVLTNLRSGLVKPNPQPAPNVLYGRIDPDGNLWDHRGAIVPPGVMALLDEMNDDPAGFIRRFGVRTGRCCFCDLPLTDETSMGWGYGPVCAKTYKLPHGVMKLRALKLAEAAATA